MMRRARLLLATLGWVALLPILKRVVPISRLAPLMWTDAAGLVRNPALEADVIRIVERLYAPGRIHRRDNCLERSLLLYHHLSKLNASPILVVGLSSPPSAGHAWVLVDGKPVGRRNENLSGLDPIVAFGVEGALLPG